jgi:hypothetical protein
VRLSDANRNPKPGILRGRVPLRSTRNTHPLIPERMFEK